MELALNLINSEEWYGRRPGGLVDHLDEPGWLTGLLERWGFGDVAAPSPAQRKQLLRIRALLRRMITAIAVDEAPSSRDVEELDRFLVGRSYHRRLGQEDGAFGLELVPSRRDWAWVLSEIAASFGELLVEGERERVKLCENPECQWAFYDTTKNRRRRWCNPAQCGNVFKVRQFRARRRADESAP
jgi:predicted RNA-binding Zn ribbon-like protein